MNRTEKHQVVESLKSDFKETEILILSHYHGLSVSDIMGIRRELKKQNDNIKVTKNRLAKLAVKDTDFENLSEKMKGPTAFTYSNDPVGAAKSVVKFSKDHENYQIIGASLNGQLLDEKAIANLAKLPSMDELKAQIIGLISSPAQKLARILQTPASNVVNVLKAHSEQNEN